MANRYPLVVASGSVQELALGDNLNLEGSSIADANNVESNSLTLANVSITTSFANAPNNTLLIVDSAATAIHPVVRIGSGSSFGAGGVIGIGTTFNRSGLTVEIYEDRGGTFGYGESNTGLFVLNPNPDGYPLIGVGTEPLNGHYAILGYRGIGGTALASGAYGPESTSFAPHGTGGCDFITFKGDSKFYTGTNPASGLDSFLRMIIKNDNTATGTYVGIGTSLPAKTLHLNGTFRFTNRGTASTQTALHINTTTGDVVETASSRRYKRDIEDYTKGLETVLQLHPVSFKYQDDENPNAGLIAEEVNELDLPEFVRYDAENAPHSIPYENLTALLINAIKDLKAEIDALKAAQ